jgi:hypothetical protein
MPKTVMLKGGPLDGGQVEIEWAEWHYEIDGGAYQPITSLEYLKGEWGWWPL